MVPNFWVVVTVFSFPSTTTWLNVCRRRVWLWWFLVTDLLKTNNVVLTADLQQFVDTRSGTVRVSDCADFPAEQGKYVLNDVLLGAGIVDGSHNLPRFLKNNIVNARGASGEFLYPSLAEVPSGHSSVSFRICMETPHLLRLPDFACFSYKIPTITVIVGILVPETTPEI